MKTFFPFEQLKKALAEIGFDPEQEKALEEAYREAAASPEIVRMLAADAGELKKPEGSTELLCPEELLRKDMKRRSSLYPVLVILSCYDGLRKNYEKKGISLKILRDTLADLSIWMSNCYRRTGQIGFYEYAWLTNHIRMKLFRLGRLQYIFTQNRTPVHVYRSISSGEAVILADEGLACDRNGELTDPSRPSFMTVFRKDASKIVGHPVNKDGSVRSQTMALSRKKSRSVLEPDSPVLDVHIPEGCPLEGIHESFDFALRFFERTVGISVPQAFICESWLMNPVLGKLLPDSRIAAFQRWFRPVPYSSDDSQVFKRVYGTPSRDWNRLPMKTELQKKIRTLYLSGGCCRQMGGILLTEELTNVP